MEKVTIEIKKSFYEEVKKTAEKKGTDVSDVIMRRYRLVFEEDEIMDVIDRLLCDALLEFNKNEVDAEILEERLNTIRNNIETYAADGLLLLRENQED